MTASMKMVNFAENELGGEVRNWRDIKAVPISPERVKEISDCLASQPRENASYKFECASEGTYIALKSSGMPARGGGQRREVRGFSRGSRRRLFQKLAKLRHDKNSLPLFVTLTYPADFPSDKVDYKRDLKVFLQRVLYTFPYASLIWKLEFQKRGAAHYHLIMFGVSQSHAIEFIPDAWAAVVGSDDENHLAWHKGELNNRHCVEPVRDWRGVMAYAAKYIGKVDTSQGNPAGRIWGTSGKLPFSHMKALKLSYKAALEFKRSFEKITGRKKKGDAAYQIGFWSFSNGVDFYGYATRIKDDMDVLKHPPVPFAPHWWKAIPRGIEEVDFF